VFQLGEVHKSGALVLTSGKTPGPGLGRETANAELKRSLRRSRNQSQNMGTKGVLGAQES